MRKSGVKKSTIHNKCTSMKLGTGWLNSKRDDNYVGNRFTKTEQEFRHSCLSRNLKRQSVMCAKIVSKSGDTPPKDCKLFLV